ncbi:MAG TPA: septal ring lytic transglycosylase RlpA family protein [Haliangium sp.]|nr:septal ring lytic transglycosylase RlpA family protein [Haliangium sp.]
MQNTSLIARATAILLLTCILSACPSMVQRPRASHADERTPVPEPEHEQGVVQSGQAGWYGKHHHGRKTASGERFNQNALTAAHRTLPFGTIVQVKNLTNGRTVVVRINDRGPFGRKKRIIDVSRAAARALHMEHAGVAPVELRIVTEVAPEPEATGPNQAR